MQNRCTCNPAEIKKGHRNDCPLNAALAPKPRAPRIPFEEMTRDQMIVAYTELRHDMALYVKELHAICAAGLKVVYNADKLGPMPLPFFEAKEELEKHLGFHENGRIKP